MHVLYVEDNEMNQALVGRVMRGRKHTVTFREDGEGALDVLVENKDVDLVLLDIELAGTMTGLDVVKTLRDRGDMRPVVAVTAYAMMGDRERILAAGCDQYLPKPLVIADLIALLDHYAELGDSTRELPVVAPDGVAVMSTREMFAAPPEAPADAPEEVPSTDATAPVPAAPAAVSSPAAEAPTAPVAAAPAPADAPAAASSPAADMPAAPAAAAAAPQAAEAPAVPIPPVPVREAAPKPEAAVPVPVTSDGGAPAPDAAMEAVLSGPEKTPPPGATL
jgi:CheY-like chemotaxis protein